MKKIKLRRIMSCLLVGIFILGSLNISFAQTNNKTATQKEIDELFVWASKNQIDIFMIENDNDLDLSIDAKSIEEIKQFLLYTKEGVNLKPIQQEEEYEDSYRRVLNEGEGSGSITPLSDVIFYDRQVYRHRGFILDTDDNYPLELSDLEARVRYSYYYDTLTGESTFHQIDSIDTYVVGNFIVRNWEHRYADEVFFNGKRRVRIDFEGISTLGITIGNWVIGSRVYCYGDFTFYPRDPDW